MLKVYTDRPDFDLGIEDYDLSGGKEISIYVLDEQMSALWLMEAFRACRYNPLRTYYYIPDTESHFSQYARESISRGTVNLFSDLEEMKEALQSEVDAWRSYSIPECITKSAANYKILLNRERVTGISVAVTAALNKNSCYTIALALEKLFQSGGSLFSQQFLQILEEVLADSQKAREANAVFARENSQFLSVLAAGGREINREWHTEEYDGMALHVMFQPFEPEGKGLDARVKIVAQLIKERQS